MPNATKSPAMHDDAQLLAEFKLWLSEAHAAVPNNPRVNSAVIELHKLETIGANLRTRALETLNHIEERFRPEILKQSELARPVRADFLHAKSPRRETYERTRDQAIEEFNRRHESLWAQRVVLAKQILTVVERSEIKRFGPIGQARPALEKFENHNVVSNSQFLEKLRGRAEARPPQRGPDIERERD
jgi:hypothetical protein